MKLADVPCGLPIRYCPVKPAQASIHFANAITVRMQYNGHRLLTHAADCHERRKNTQRLSIVLMLQWGINKVTNTAVCDLTVAALLHA